MELICLTRHNYQSREVPIDSQLGIMADQAFIREHDQKNIGRVRCDSLRCSIVVGRRQTDVVGDYYADRIR